MMDGKKAKTMVQNAADPGQVNNARKKKELERKQELQDIHDILSTVQGRRFLFRLINNLCHYDADDFNHSGSITNYNLGQRSIGKEVKSDCIEASLKLYQQSEQENWKFITGGD